MERKPRDPALSLGKIIADYLVVFSEMLPIVIGTFTGSIGDAAHPELSILGNPIVWLLLRRLVGIILLNVKTDLVEMALPLFKV